MIERRFGDSVGFGKMRRYVDAPTTEVHSDGVKRLRDTVFAGMNLLAFTKDTKDYCPTSVTIKIRDKKLRLRLGEVWEFLASPHEVSSLLSSPSALRLIEDHDVIIRRP